MLKDVRIRRPVFIPSASYVRIQCIPIPVNGLGTMYNRSLFGGLRPKYISTAIIGNYDPNDKNNLRKRVRSGVS